MSGLCFGFSPGPGTSVLGKRGRRCGTAARNFNREIRFCPQFGDTRRLKDWRTLTPAALNVM